MRLTGGLLVVAVLSSGCGYARAGAGEEVVLVRKPWFFGSGGIVPTPVKAGSRFVAWSTEELKVNVQPRTFIQHFNDMFTNDGVPLEFNVATKLQVSDSVRMARDFGVWEYDSGGGILWPGWYGNTSRNPLRTSCGKRCGNTASTRPRSTQSRSTRSMPKSLRR